jgi:outer membrane protein TolC
MLKLPLFWARTRSPRTVTLLLATGLAFPALPLQAQSAPGALQGGVPTGEPTRDEIALSLADAVQRGLRHNLGAILSEAAVDGAQAAQAEARAALLPQLRASLVESRQKINLAAYGFDTPGTPPLVGPFNVFDARASVDQTVLDVRAFYRAHASARSLAASRAEESDIRDLIVLYCGQLYLQAVAGESRIEAARAQLQTAQALLTLARDRKTTGLAAGIDVLRAQVQEQLLRQRLIVAEHDATKDKLALARAIGLPLGQPFRLANAMPEASAITLTTDEAVARAWTERPDLKAAQARVEAAEASRKAAWGERLPSLVLHGDYGSIGNDAPSALATFTLGASLRVPLFEGGRVQSHVREAEARIREERARLADLRAQIYYEVQTVFLDLKAADERVGVAESALGLARDQLEQARDRFAAGIADNVEVVQAQEALATATENHIASLYAQTVARLSLARTLGGAEASYTGILKGR